MNVFLLLGLPLYVDVPEELGIFSSQEKAIAFLRTMLETGKIVNDDYEDFSLERHEVDNPENFEIVPIVL